MFKRKPRPENQTKGEKPVKPKFNWFKFSVIANIVIVALVVIVFGSMAVINESETNPNFCRACHNMEKHVDSYLNGSTMDAVHAKAGVGCKDCHADYSLAAEISSGIKYVTGNYDESMPRRKFDEAMCTGCHISLEYHAARTDFLVRNPHWSHWPDLKCGTCHLSHGEQVDYCSQCHDNGGQRLTGGEIIPRAINPWADNTN
ncbi:MAG TPA: cytochrome c3 family protein [Bellilinea sp.]|nr:cytochrome c3 family protein [Bellilinea sp.]